MDPRCGVNSPASNRRSVDLPAPLDPMRPVVPLGKVADNASNTGSPSGQENVRFETEWEDE